jgi:hypothetical protein
MAEPRIKRRSATIKRPESSEGPITKIKVAGFKSILKEQVLHLKPLTVLAGANSSGKSSLMQPVLLLKQTLDSQHDPGALLLDGPNVKLTTAAQLLSRSGTSVAKEFAVSFSTSNGELGLHFKAPGRGVELDANLVLVGEKLFTLRQNSEFSLLKELLKTTNLPETILNDAKLSVVRDRFLFSIELELKGGPTGIRFPPTSNLPLERFLSDLIHVPGLRGNPARTYKTTAIGPQFPGTFEAYIASVINHWQREDMEQLKKLSGYLESLGLTWKVEAKPVDDTQVELMVGRLPHARRGGAKDLVSIADVGFGVSQTLPVVVALLVAKRGQVVYIEQPEIHLHPIAQCALAKVLADASNRGVIVIVETHSSLLLTAIQTLVAQGYVKPALVKLHWVKRDRDGATEVIAADLDDAGAFGEWPTDFADVIMNAETEYLDAAEQKMTLQ